MDQPRLAVLDANLLYPFQLRNLVVQLGVDAVFSPRWSARIHEEWIDSLVRTGRVSRERLLVTRDIMDAALPAALVADWEMHMDGLALPDPEDNHVLAAALACGATTIVTFNQRDFPAAALSVHGILAIHPDDFLCGLFDADPEVVRASAAEAHANLSRSIPSLAQYRQTLAQQGLPGSPDAWVREPPSTLSAGQLWIRAFRRLDSSVRLKHVGFARSDEVPHQRHTDSRRGAASRSHPTATAR